MANRKGIELLRYTVDVLNDCSEAFNDQFTASDIIRIGNAMQQSRWDIYPDRWDEKQVNDCIRHNIVPDWNEDETGELIPVYKGEQ